MIGIIDYGLGNMTSVKNALDKLSIANIISRDKNILEKADALILPGVGAAAQGMENLQKYDLLDFVREQAKTGKPFLGICLGMQLLFDYSEEGNIACLGIIPGIVKKFSGKIKIPQIGWNNVRTINTKSNSFFYFVNSYYCVPKNKANIAGITNYGKDFCSIVVNKNVMGTQFHPEKSGSTGLTLLKKFATL